MTALGIDMTSSDPVYGWEAIKPTKRRQSDTQYLVGEIWQRHKETVDQLETCDDAEKRAELAKEANCYIEMALYIENGQTESEVNDRNEPKTN